MGRTRKTNLEEIRFIDANYEFDSQHKEDILAYLNEGGIVDIHKSEDKLKWRDYLYSVYKERLYTREIDQNDLTRYAQDKAMGNEIFRVVDVEKTDFETFLKVMKTRASDKENGAITGYIVVKCNRKCDKGREIDSRIYRLTSNFMLFKENGEKCSIIARDGQSVIQLSDIKDYVRKDEIDYCYFIGKGNIIINEDLFKNAFIDEPVISEDETEGDLSRLEENFDEDNEEFMNKESE